jgi:hypothetical protein
MGTIFIKCRLHWDFFTNVLLLQDPSQDTTLYLFSHQCPSVSSANDTFLVFDDLDIMKNTGQLL